MARYDLDKFRWPARTAVHQQPEPRGAFLTFVESGAKHFRVQELSIRAAGAPNARWSGVRVTVSSAVPELDFPSAESTMCKRAAVMWTKNATITASPPQSPEFQDQGRVHHRAESCVFNSETIAGDVRSGESSMENLTAERSLTIYSAAEIQEAV